MTDRELQAHSISYELYNEMRYSKLYSATKVAHTAYKLAIDFFNRGYDYHNTRLLVISSLYDLGDYK